MNGLSFCKSIEYGGFIDYEKFNIFTHVLRNDENGNLAYRVVISDNTDIIKSYFSVSGNESVIFVPLVVLLKDNTPYAMMKKCISRGATALLIKMN